MADATPWASVIADTCGVPSVICSNFSWDDQYEALYAGDAAVREQISTVRAVVHAFTAALELPLGPGVPAVAVRHAMPLVARWPSGRAMPEAGGLPLVTWAFGRTPPAQQPLEALERLAGLCSERGLRLAASEPIARAVTADVHALPDHLYWPDVLAASRLVVTKAGYSTVAETLRGRGHVVSLGITGLPEERAMLVELEAAGYGLGVALDVDDVAEALVLAATDLLDRAPRAPLLDGGEHLVVDALEALVGV